MGWIELEVGHFGLEQYHKKIARPTLVSKSIKKSDIFFSEAAFIGHIPWKGSLENFVIRYNSSSFHCTALRKKKDSQAHYFVIIRKTNSSSLIMPEQKTEYSISGWMLCRIHFRARWESKENTLKHSRMLDGLFIKTGGRLHSWSITYAQAKGIWTVTYGTFNLTTALMNIFEPDVPIKWT